MKETNIDNVRQTVSEAMEEENWLILNYVSKEVATLIVTNIYMMNDQTSGFGQDIGKSISVIASRKKISVISEQRSSFYQADQPLCLYEDLDEDVSEIMMVLEAAIVRMEANM